MSVFSCGCNNRHYTLSLSGDLMGFNLTPSYYDARCGQKELSGGIREGVTMTGRMILWTRTEFQTQKTGH